MLILFGVLLIVQFIRYNSAINRSSIGKCWWLFETEKRWFL